MSQQEAEIKLHLGCGHRFIEGFVHIDAQRFEHIDHVGSVANLDQFAVGSVNLIYACHVLEHFGRHEYMSVLREWFRVLRPGGVLRLSVPDFAKSVNLYLDDKPSTGGMEALWGALVGGQDNELDFHKIVFDRETLENSLIEAGFASTRLWDWRATDHAHVDDHSQAYHPHMDKDNGMLMSLNVEAVK